MPHSPIRAASIPYVYPLADGHVCVLDHDRKTVEYLMQSLADYSREDVEMDVLEVMSHSLVRPMVKSEKIHFSPKHGWFGGERIENVEGWEAKLYELQGFGASSSPVIIIQEEL